MFKKSSNKEKDTDTILQDAMDDLQEIVSQENLARLLHNLNQVIRQGPLPPNLNWISIVITLRNLNDYDELLPKKTKSKISELVRTKIQEIGSLESGNAAFQTAFIEIMDSIKRELKKYFLSKEALPLLKFKESQMAKFEQVKADEAAALKKEISRLKSEKSNEPGAPVNEAEEEEDLFGEIREICLNSVDAIKSCSSKQEVLAYVRNLVDIIQADEDLDEKIDRIHIINDLHAQAEADKKSDNKDLEEWVKG